MVSVVSWWAGNWDFLGFWVVCPVLAAPRREALLGMGYFPFISIDVFSQKYSPLLRRDHNIEMYNMSHNMA